MTERIGILGGTFDPVHVGHLAVAAQARWQLGLDRVLLVVANVPWQKVGARPISAAEDRLAMVRAAVADHEGLEASPIEIERGGESYTADTLDALRRPGRELFLIIGSDLVDDLVTWKRADELPALCTLAVAFRPDEADRAVSDIDGSQALRHWTRADVRVPALDLSSTELRTMVAEGRPVDFLVPDPVIAIIAARNLYRATSSGPVPSATARAGRGRFGPPDTAASVPSVPFVPSVPEELALSTPLSAALSAAPTALPATSRVSVSTGREPAMRRAVDEIHRLAIAAARAADDKKASDVVVIDVGDTLSITDAFVIASASNSRLVATIVEAVELGVKRAGGDGPIAIEGLAEASWVLLDFGGFVVHVFLEETRRYYDLERLWADAPAISWR